MPVLPMNASAEPRGANKRGHRNAPLTPKGRLRLCLRIDAGRPTDRPSGAFACFPGVEFMGSMHVFTCPVPQSPKPAKGQPVRFGRTVRAPSMALVLLLSVPRSALLTGMAIGLSF